MSVTGTFTSRPTVGAFSGLSPLVAEALLDLRASDWTSGTWTNRGTEGSSLNGVQDGLTDQVTPTKVGGAVRVQSTSAANENQYGFSIASPLLDWPDTGGVTFAVDYTELDHGDATESAKILWKYPAVDLPTSLEGWVAENVPTQGGLLISGNSGSVNPWPDGAKGAAYPGASVGVRRLLTFVVDRSDDTLTVYRNGVVLTALFGFPMGDSDRFATTAPLRIGADNDFYRILAWDRALTATEATADLPNELGVA